MNFAVVDDVPKDRLILKEDIRIYCEQNRITAQIMLFESGEAFLQAFETIPFDIVFLDIYMNGIDGLETARRIRERSDECILIFSTTSEQHAVKSFRVRAFDYLVKPYQYDQFEEIMRLVDKTLLKRAHYIEVKEGRGFIKVLLRTIRYADYYNHYVQIHTNERMIRSYLPFSEFAPQLLMYPQFLYCYRNCIINMDRVNTMDEKDFIMQDGERIPIARAQRVRIRQYYADYIFQRLEGSV